MEQRLFARIIGHPEVCEFLRLVSQNGHLAHAYLLVGPEGVGKTAILEELLASWSSSAKNPDLLRVARLTDEKTGQRKSQISVAQIRTVCERLALSAMGEGRKAVFIEEADRLHPAAANALLKTLEEPRGKTTLFLRATQLEAVPETLISRCQILRLGSVPAEILKAALVERGLDPVTAEEFSQAAAGRPGVALRLMQDSSYQSEREVAKTALNYFVDESLAARLGRAAALLPKSESNRPEILEKYFDLWEGSLRERLLLALQQGAALKRWQEGIRALRQARLALRHNGNPQLVLEHFLINL